MQMIEGLVSIIVPVHNAGAYIETTIETVKAQTYTQWELILVNDNSEDDSRAKILGYMKENDKQIQLIDITGANVGAAGARNKGIESAKGRYIAFLDADDLWAPDKLEKELAFRKEKDAGFVFSAYEFGDKNGAGTGKVVSVPVKLTYKEALSRTVIFTSTVLLDRKQIGEQLIRMPDVKSEDTAAWWKIMRNGHTAYGLNEVLVVYRRPANSLSSNKVEAVRRIWNLYRREEKLPLFYSIYNLFFWALRATLRRI